jgi:lipopolysaccharide export system permease protein
VKIISRYILKEHTGPLLFALSALTSLLLLNYVAKQFGNLVGKGLGWGVIGEFFLLSVPFTVAMTLPMAVLVSTLYAFSRLAAENEITALKASGVGMRRLMIPILLGAAALAMVMIGFNDQVLPRANHRLRVLQTDIGRKKPTFALREQVINEVSPGKLFLRAGHIDEATNHIREVTIYDLSNPAGRRTIYADSGDMGFSPDLRDLQMTLFDGYMQELPKEEAGQLQRLFFHVNRVRIPDVGNTFSRDSNDTYKSDREMSICEMQAEVDQAQKRYATAQRQLEELLVNAVRTATGEPLPPSEWDEGGDRSLGIAPIYCSLLAMAGAGVDEAGIEEAEAAEDGFDVASSQVRSNDSLAAIEAIRAAQNAVPPQVSERAPLAGKRPAPSAGKTRVQLPEAARPRAAPARPPMPRDPIVLSTVTGTLEAARAQMEASAADRNAYDVEIQKKFALAVACLVFVLLGAPIALRFPRGGVGLVITVSLVVFALYYIGLIAGESLADRGMVPPVLSMWAANILFTIVGLFFLARMGREANTARGGDTRELIDTLRSGFARAARRVGVRMDRRRRAV